MLNFKDLGLSASIIQNLLNAGYHTPTGIQAQAIPVILSGADILATAQTGTGKTAAFSLPLIHRLITIDDIHPLRALIIVPTRELCSQINKALETYSSNTGVRSCAVYGGVAQEDQVKAIRKGVDIIVATPGRFLDLVKQKVLKLSQIEAFVLDEADQMLDMGFLDDIVEINNLLPAKKQTLLFSATMPEEIKNLAEKILVSPAKIELASAQESTPNIQQKVIYCKKEVKFQLLKKMIKEEKPELLLVFTRTKNTADNVVEYLAQNRIASRAIHGDKKQVERERAMSHFKDGVIKVLVATDIAARGIHIEDVSHVVNFDLPIDPETYVHRIGRTARAGKEGAAVSFCDDSEKAHLGKIQQYMQVPFKTEKFEGRSETLKFKNVGGKMITPPTPGKSQEKTAYLDHSKRRPLVDEGAAKRTHPGFKKTKKRRK